MICISMHDTSAYVKMLLLKTPKWFRRILISLPKLLCQKVFLTKSSILLIIQKASTTIQNLIGLSFLSRLTSVYVRTNVCVCACACVYVCVCVCVCVRETGCLGVESIPRLLSKTKYFQNKKYWIAIIFTFHEHKKSIFRLPDKLKQIIPLVTNIVISKTRRTREK